jgi:hypothetical protein
MSSYVDKMFINRVSGSLRNFKWKKETLANCSCPICGDSQKNKSKARGYFYQVKNDFFYKCHNCNIGTTLYNFLDKISPELSKEYSMERWKDGDNHHSNYKKPREEELFKFKDSKPKFKKRDKVLDDLTCLADLPKEHPAVRFADMRQIPRQHFPLLHFTDDFGSFVRHNLDPDVFIGKEDRIVIPFFNSHGDVVAVQGRAINFKDEENARQTAKYITIKADKSIDRLWYGLWRANTKKRVYVVEGPIDSLFLENAVAMVGAGALKEIPKRFDNTPMTYILDNEPRNRQICAYNEKLIEMGKEVCIWPKEIVEKDINDMAYRLSTRKIQKIIDENTYSGLEATLRFNEWRKA